MNRIKKATLLTSKLLLPVFAIPVFTIFAEMAHSSKPMNSIMASEGLKSVISLATPTTPVQKLQTVDGIPQLDNRLYSTVEHVVDTNVSTVASIYNNKYWGIEESWKLSITDLKTFITASYYDVNMRNHIVSSLCKNLISAVGKNKEWIKIKKKKELALGLMTDFLIYETLWQVKHNPTLTTVLVLNLNKESETKLYNIMYKSAYAQVLKQLATEGMPNSEFVFNEDEFKKVANDTPAKYFKHDWDCYLTQFFVLHAGEIASQDKKIRIGSVLSKVNTLIGIKEQCAKRIKLLMNKNVGNADELINEFETNNDFKKSIASINQFTKTEVLKIDHNNLNYLLFLCNFCELQMSIKNKKLDSPDTVINTWKKLITKADKNLSQPPQRYLADLRLIMSMVAISALDYKITVNEKSIENILNIFNQIQQYGLKTSKQVIDDFTGCHLAISLIKNNIKLEDFLNEIAQIKQSLPNINFKTMGHLALLACLSKNDSSFKTFGSAIDLYKTLETMTKNSLDAEIIAMDCVNLWKKGGLPGFIQKFDKVKCVFSNGNSLKKYYKGKINKDVLNAFRLYATTYGFGLGNQATYFQTDKFINRDTLLNLLKGIDFDNKKTDSKITTYKDSQCEHAQRENVQSKHTQCVHTQSKNTPGKQNNSKVVATKVNPIKTEKVKSKPVKNNSSTNSETVKIETKVVEKEPNKVPSQKIMPNKTLPNNKKISANNQNTTSTANFHKALNKHDNSIKETPKISANRNIKVPDNKNNNKTITSVPKINGNNNSNVNEKIIITNNSTVINPDLSNSSVIKKPETARNNRVNENENSNKLKQTITKNPKISNVINKLKNKKTVK